jgi:enoyl-CoA hydratase/carnithine racemase
MRMALFGNDERISAARALAIGLVSEVVGRDQLWERAQVLAKRLADKPPLAVQGTVKAVWDSLSMTIEASRSVPLMYTQLINPKTKTEFDPGAERSWEIR